MIPIDQKETKQSLIKKTKPSEKRSKELKELLIAAMKERKEEVLNEQRE